MIMRIATAGELPDGEYVGKWSGYEVKFEHDGRTYYLQTKLGVRGINIPCKFRINDGVPVQESIIAG